MFTKQPVSQALASLTLLDSSDINTHKEEAKGNEACFSSSSSSLSSTSSTATELRDLHDDAHTDVVARLDQRPLSENGDCESDADSSAGVGESRETRTLPRTPHEVLYSELDPPVAPDSSLIRPDHSLKSVGSILAFIDGLVVVQSALELAPQVRASLGEDSLFCFEDRQPLGFVFEVFGSVQRPMYILRVDARDTALCSKIRVGCAVYYVEELLRPLELEKNAKRGCDACDEFGEELHSSDLEFSDDDEEARARSRRRRQVTQTPLLRSSGSSSLQGRQSNPFRNRVWSQRQRGRAAASSAMTSTAPTSSSARDPRSMPRQRAAETQVESAALRGQASRRGHGRHAAVRQERALQFR
jgi:H/ACA ribonucleoprotein complex non-core subunit NAF1